MFMMVDEGRDSGTMTRRATARFIFINRDVANSNVWQCFVRKTGRRQR